VYPFFCKYLYVDHLKDEMGKVIFANDTIITQSRSKPFFCCCCL